MQEREQMKLKEAKHVGEGLEQGAKSLFKGFEKGITGFFLFGNKFYFFIIKYRLIYKAHRRNKKKRS